MVEHKKIRRYPVIKHKGRLSFIIGSNFINLDIFIKIYEVINWI
jgi:hypothetical protein